MTEMTLIDAVRSALFDELERDSSVIVLGEDVGQGGGVFRATDGLLARFGPERVIDTPLAELGIVGFGRIGKAVAAKAAAFGMRVAFSSRTSAASPLGEAMPLEQVMHLAFRGEGRLRQMPKVPQHDVTLAKRAARDFPDHERVDQDHALVEQRREFGVAVPQVVDPDRRVDDGHGFGRRRDRSATVAVGSEPARRRKREECSRAMSARKPSCTSAVFSVTPVSRRASSNNASSRIMVVLMHASMAHFVPRCPAAAPPRR